MQRSRSSLQKLFGNSINAARRARSGSLMRYMMRRAFTFLTMRISGQGAVHDSDGEHLLQAWQLRWRSPSRTTVQDPARCLVAIRDPAGSESTDCESGFCSNRDD
jgi:hypothetical protein